jgi:hypothetical protein
MKNTFKIALVIYFLFLNFISFAQPSGGDTGGAIGLEGGTGATGATGTEDGAPVPIDSKLWILIILGIVYSFFLIRRNHQLKKLS